MRQFLGGVEGQLRRDRVLHRPLDELGAEPVLVVGEPLARIGPVEGLQQLIDVHPDDLASPGSHRASSPPLRGAASASIEPRGAALVHRILRSSGTVGRASQSAPPDLSSRHVRSDVASPGRLPRAHLGAALLALGARGVLVVPAGHPRAHLPGEGPRSSRRPACSPARTGTATPSSTRCTSAPSRTRTGTGWATCGASRHGWTSSRTSAWTPCGSCLIMPSPLADSGYDVSDYRGIHPGLRHDGRLRRPRRGGARPRDARDARPRHEPHVGRSPVVPGVGAADRTNPRADWYVWSDTPVPSRHPLRSGADLRDERVDLGRRAGPVLLPPLPGRPSRT